MSSTTPPTPDSEEQVTANLQDSNISNVVSEDADGVLQVGDEISQSQGCCKQQPMLTLAKYTNQAVMGEDDCNAMLDTLDSCVACAEGVDLQTQYEDKLDRTMPKNMTSMIDQHGLSEKEAALIRLQVMEEEKKRILTGQEKFVVANEMMKNGKDNKPYGNMLDGYNLCGFDDGVAPWECPSPSDSKKPRSQINESCGSNTKPSMLSQNLPSLCGGPGDEQQHEQELTSSFSQSTLKIGNPPADSPMSANTEHCAVCFDQPHRREIDSSLLRSFAYLPCCGHKKSSIKICAACILLLCTPTSDGKERVGKCPRCRCWIKVYTDKRINNIDDFMDTNLSLNKMQTFNITGITIRKVDKSGQCVVCNQVKDCLIDKDAICDACYLGRRCPLLYECEQCHNSQPIPHPMYRYQPSPDQFGNSSWKCQASCKNFTKWRILPDQINIIPVGDSPIEWGENNLEVARIRVIEARRGIVSSSRHKRIDITENRVMDSCVIS